MLPFIRPSWKQSYEKRREQIYKKIKAGDEEAFKRIFYLYSDRLFVWAYKITGDSSVSEDIVQDFFYLLLGKEGYTSL